MRTNIPVAVGVMGVFNIIQSTCDNMILLFQVSVVHTATVFSASKCLSGGFRYWSKIARIDFTIDKMHLDEIIHGTVEDGRL